MVLPDEAQASTGRGTLKLTEVVPSRKQANNGCC
jgi:hypothetical protein